MMAIWSSVQYVVFFWLLAYTRPAGNVSSNVLFRLQRKLHGKFLKTNEWITEKSLKFQAKICPQPQAILVDVTSSLGVFRCTEYCITWSLQIDMMFRTLSFRAWCIKGTRSPFFTLSLSKPSNPPYLVIPLVIRLFVFIIIGAFSRLHLSSNLFNIYHSDYWLVTMIKP